MKQLAGARGGRQLVLGAPELPSKPRSATDVDTSNKLGPPNWWEAGVDSWLHTDTLWSAAGGAGGLHEEAHWVIRCWKMMMVPVSPVKINRLIWTTELIIWVLIQSKNKSICQVSRLKQFIPRSVFLRVRTWTRFNTTHRKSVQSSQILTTRVLRVPVSLAAQGHGHV